MRRVMVIVVLIIICIGYFESNFAQSTPVIMKQLNCKKNISSSEVRRINTNLSNYLHKNNKISIVKIISASSHQTSKNDMIKIAKEFGALKIISGNLMKINNIMAITLKIIDTKTGCIKEASSSCNGSIDEFIGSSLNKVVKDILSTIR